MRVLEGLLGVVGTRKLRRVRLAGLAVVVLLAGFVSSAFGQAATATITGTVTDAQGAAMVGATVVLRNNDTGVERTFGANEVGLYRALLLPVGSYDVTASQTGFATVQRLGVRVQVGQVIRIDIEMPVAAQQALVTVTAETPVLETEKTENSQNISETLVSNLPISSRRWEQFVLLTPGLTPDGADGYIVFHGASSMYNTNSVDGANNNHSQEGGARGGNIDGYAYSTDSIREFQVKSSGFGADVGQSAGGSVNAVTKSGTSVWHGDGFYNHRQPSFNAFDPLIKARSTNPTQAVHQQHQYGGSFGGPVIQDKLFVFGTYDGYRKITPISYTTSQQNPTIDNIACPTALTQAQCDNIANFTLTQNLGTFPRTLRQDIEFLKFDAQLTPNHHVSGLANVRDWKIPNGTAFATSNNQGITARNNPAFQQNRFFIATWTALVSPTMVNEFRFHWGDDNDWAEPRGFPPQARINRITRFNPGSTIPNFTYEKRMQFSNNFSFTKGVHSFKVGIDINQIQDNRLSGTPKIGRYDYSNAATAIPGCLSTDINPNTGNTVTSREQQWCGFIVDLYGVDAGDGLTGKHWNIFSQIRDTRAPGDTFSGASTENYTDLAFFFQDTWKAAQNVTVNAGIRYDIFFLPQKSIGSLDTGINLRAPIYTLYTSRLNVDYKAVQPRLGIAWNFAPNSVLRLGAGVFFAKTIGSTFLAALRANGIREQTFNCQPTDTTALCVNLKYPDVLFAQQTSAPQALPVTGARAPVVHNPLGDQCLDARNCNARGLDPNLLRPRNYQFEIALEHVLPGNINASASYVHTRGVHLPAHYDGNLDRPTTKFYDVVDDSGATTQEIGVPFFTKRIDETAAAILSEFSIINSRYNGLILSARKPMSRGFEVIANYTLSKATDGGMPFGSTGSRGNHLEGQQIFNPYNRLPVQSLSGIHSPHRFTSSVIWQPGFARGMNSAARALLDGWSLSGSITATTGTRYSALMTSSSVQCKSAVSLTSCPDGERGLDGGITASFLRNVSIPAPGYATWIARSGFAKPRYTNVDLRIAKSFSIIEGVSFELRGEMFNLLNSTLVLDVEQDGFGYARPGQSGCAADSHSNTCLIPQSDFGDATQTSSTLLGARQVQFGARLNF